jgi:hypothetical protein
VKGGEGGEKRKLDHGFKNLMGRGLLKINYRRRKGGHIPWHREQLMSIVIGIRKSIWII